MYVVNVLCHVISMLLRMIGLLRLEILEVMIRKVFRMPFLFYKFELSPMLKINQSKSGLAGINVASQALSSMASLAGCKFLELPLVCWVFLWVVILDIFLFRILWWRKSLSALMLGKGLIFRQVVDSPLFKLVSLAYLSTSYLCFAYKW